jgi:GTP-binding protein
MEWIEDDELIEVTPENVRIRKRYLDPTMRKRIQRDKKNAGK